MPCEKWMAKDGEVAPPFQSLCVSRCTFSPPGSYEMADAVIEAEKEYLTFPKDDFSEHLCASSPYTS
jgi:hypothetical protein